MENIIISNSSNVDDMLTNMLSVALDGDDKQQFIMNFQLYLMYGNDTTQYVVDLDSIWEWLGFSKKDKAKDVLIRNFEKDVDYIIVLPGLRENPQTVENPLGGRPKEKIMINVETFKAFCMLANTEKGKRTRRYYSKMESVFFKYMEERHRATVLALENERSTLERNLKLETQKKLIETNKNTSLVYILKVQETDADNFIIKIGETDDIEQRMTSLRQEYRDCLLIDAFPCTRPHAFEQYILHRKDVMKYRFISTETIQISTEFPYETLKKIIKKHIDNFNGLSPTQRVELARTKYQEKLLDSIQSTTDNAMKQQLIDILKSNTYPKEDDSDSEDSSNDNDIPYRHRVVYQYDVSNLSTPIKTYNSLRQAARSLNNPNFYDYHIRDASNSNTVFADYRWLYLDGENDKPPAELPPTQEEPSSSRNTGVIAQINKENTQIINVFASQKDAEKETKIHNSQISIGVSTGKIKSGFIWKLYEDCSTDLKSTYQGIIPEPKRTTTCSKVVQRIDPDTNQILETYHCIQDICSVYKCCHKSINKASKSGDIFKGYKWNIVNE